MLNQFSEWVQAGIDGVKAPIQAAQERVDTARAGKALLDCDANGCAEQLIRAKLAFCGVATEDASIMHQIHSAIVNYEEVASHLRTLALASIQSPGVEHVDFSSLAACCEERARRYRICTLLGGAPATPPMAPAERDAAAILQVKAKAGFTADVSRPLEIAIISQGSKEFQTPPPSSPRPEDAIAFFGCLHTDVNAEPILVPERSHLDAFPLSPVAGREKPSGELWSQRSSSRARPIMTAFGTVQEPYEQSASLVPKSFGESFGESIWTSAGKFSSSSSSPTAASLCGADARLDSMDSPILACRAPPSLPLPSSPLLSSPNPLPTRRDS